MSDSLLTILNSALGDAGDVGWCAFLRCRFMWAEADGLKVGHLLDTDLDPARNPRTSSSLPNSHEKVQRPFSLL